MKLVILTPERELVAWRDHRPHPLGQPPAVPFASWSTAAPALVRYAWPTFSPDGSRVAVFRREEGQETNLAVLDLKGLFDLELGSLSGLPLHLAWSPRGDHVATLTQQGEDLRSTLVALSDGQTRVVASSAGSLFSCFVPDGRLVVHRQVSEGRRAVECLGPGEPQPLHTEATGFCTPMVFQGRVVLVGAGPRGARVLFQPLDGGPASPGPYLNGLAAFLPDPQDRRLALASLVPGSDAYGAIQVLDGQGRTLARLADGPLAAFFWTRDGKALVGAEPLSDGEIAWHHFALDGSSRPLFRHRPTRDLSFWLRFFEQFALTHPLLGQDEALYLPTAPHPGGTGQAQVWRVPLDGQPPAALAPGLFAVCPPYSPAQRT